MSQRGHVAESVTRLTLQQLTVLEEAFTTTAGWVELAKKHGISRAELLVWRSLPAWKEEWTRRELLVLAEHDARLRVLVSVASQQLLKLALGKGEARRVGRDGRILPGPEPQPVPYAVQMQACEILLNMGSQRERLEDAVDPVKDALLGRLAAAPPDAPPEPEDNS